MLLLYFYLLLGKYMILRKRSCKSLLARFYMICDIPLSGICYTNISEKNGFHFQTTLQALISDQDKAETRGESSPFPIFTNQFFNLNFRVLATLTFLFIWHLLDRSIFSFGICDMELSECFSEIIINQRVFSLSKIFF